MERIRHIAETQQPHTYEGESHHEREEIDPLTEYNQESEMHPEQVRVREYLNSIDEELLFDIILDHARRSGIDEETAPLISIDDVRIELSYPDIEARVQGSFEGGVLEFYANEIPDELEMLRALIHEELHAVTRNADLSGIERGDGEQDRLHVSSNEAITELITDHVFTSYLYQAGNSHEETLQQKMEESYRDFSNERQVLEFYIELISMLSGVSMETAREGIVRTYFRNSSIVSEEMIDSISSIHPELPSRLIQVLEAEETDDEVLPDLVNWLLAQPINAEYRTVVETIYRDITFEEVAEKRSA